MSVDIQHGTAHVNGIQIHYLLAGRGPSLILLHGAPQSSHAWRHIMPVLARTYTIIAPDLRGYGDSEKPDSGYEVHTMAEDVRQLALHLKLGPVEIIGHDLGGIVAYVYASKFGDEVRRLSVIEAPIFGVQSTTMQQVLASYWHIGFQAHPRLPELLLTGREREYVSEFIRTYQHNMAAPNDADIEEYARHMAAPGGIRGAMGVYRTIAAEVPKILELTKTKLAMPVWAVGGQHSMSSGPIEQFAQLGTDVRGGVIAESGHWVAEEQPEKLLISLE